MASTLLEQTRALHEDLEVLEQAMYKELGDPSTVRMRRADEIARDQVVATLLQAHTQRSAQLARLYEDADGARAVYEDATLHVAQRGFRLGCSRRACLPACLASIQRPRGARRPRGAS